MKTQWMTSVVAAVALCSFFTWQRHDSDAHADEIVQPMPDAEVARPDADIAAFMHAKMVHSQTVLHGLVTQDFAEVESGAEKLRASSLLSPGPHSTDALDDELYEHFRLEFLRLSTKLGEMARDENLEGAAFTYNNLTANCMACHQYLQDHATEEVTQGDVEVERR